MERIIGSELNQNESTTLNNGVRVVSVHLPHVETVTLGAYFNVGARDEDKSVNGIAHVLEHMAFKGTTTKSAKEIAEMVESVGGYLNAYTSRETTAYYARLLKEHAHLGLGVLADILQNSVFAQEELDKERHVIIQEIGQTYDTPDDVLFDYFQDTAFPDQPMGRPILGSVDNVASFTSVQVKHYLESHYGAEKMVIAAAGNIRHAELVEKAHELFGTFRKNDQFNREPSNYTGGDFRQQRDLEQTHVTLGFKGIPLKDPDFYSVAMLSTILGSGMSSRLFQEVREKRGLVYSVYAFSSSYRDDGLFTIYAGTSPEKVESLIPVVCEQLLDVTQNLSDKEIDRARSQIKAGLMMGLESTSGRCEQLANQMLVHGRVIPLQETLQKIEAVTKSTIQNIAKKIFMNQKPTFACLGNLQNVPDFSTIEGYMKG